jgi:outer membrane protein TolC
VIVEQQEQNLDQLSKGVERLGNVGKNINQEVKEQGAQLDELDAEIDQASGTLHQAMEGIQKLLGTKDTCQLAGLFVLTVAFVVLCFLVLYT